MYIFSNSSRCKKVVVTNVHLTGVDGNSLKEKYFPGSLAFYAHNNKTQEEVKAIKDYHGSYDAIQNPDGTWSLITIYDRSGTSIQHDYPRYEDPAWAGWGETAPVATVTLPKLNTTSANYHYNTKKGLGINY